MTMLTRYSAFPNIFDELLNFSVDNFHHQKFPFCDVYLESDVVIFEFALAGYKKEEIDIQIDKKILTVSFEKKEESESNKSRHYYIKSLSKRSFNKSFVLSDEIDIDSSEAKFENGILSISFKKCEKNVKQIEIQ